MAKKQNSKTSQMSSKSSSKIDSKNINKATLKNIKAEKNNNIKKNKEKLANDKQKAKDEARLKYLLKQEELAKKNKRKKKTVKTPTIDYVNEFIPLHDIRDGMIITSDGRYIKILEILPTNFMQQSTEDRDDTLLNFQRLFTILPRKSMFYTMNSKTDVRPIVRNTKHKMQGNTNKKLLAAAGDYINTVDSLKNNSGISTKYYIIYEYDAAINEEGTSYNSIRSTMYNIAYQIKDIMHSCGNQVIERTINAENNFLFEFLYKFYNRRSSLEEDLQDRINRLNYDAAEYYNTRTYKTKKSFALSDYIAPRGIDTTHKDLFLADGIYYSFLTITDNGYPSYVLGAWLDLFANDVGIDISIIYQKQPREFSKTVAQKRALFSRAGMYNVRDKEKLEQKQNISANNEYISAALKAGEDLFRTTIIFVVWGEKPSDIYAKRNTIISKMKENQIKYEKVKNDCDAYFRTISPFLTFNRFITSRNSHDFLSSSASANYNFTKFSLFDESGFVIGTNQFNGSIISINNFNTKLFKNANMAIFGTTGSGKSYLEMLLTRRSRFCDINTYFILPVKGYEYEQPVRSIGGEFVKLAPGSPHCINIMGIMPEGSFNSKEIDENELSGASEESLLSKKIKTIITWMQLRLGDEMKLKSTDKALLNKLLHSVYLDFGITEDNNSIYDENGNLVPMPTLRTLYDHAKLDEDNYKYVVTILEDFIHGQYGNFVGQTNIDLTNPCIAFDVDDRIIDEDDLASIMYIAFDCAYSLAVSNPNYSDVILDEVWKMMKDKECAKQVEMMARLIRGYGGSIITATQKFTDYLKSEEGQALIGNSKIKIVLNLEKTEVNMIADILELNEGDVKQIIGFNRGFGMIIANGLHIPITIEASEVEDSIFDPKKSPIILDTEEYIYDE